MSWFQVFRKLRVLAIDNITDITLYHSTGVHNHILTESIMPILCGFK